MIIYQIEEQCHHFGLNTHTRISIPLKLQLFESIYFLYYGGPGGTKGAVFSSRLFLIPGTTSTVVPGTRYLTNLIHHITVRGPVTFRIDKIISVKVRSTKLQRRTLGSEIILYSLIP